MTGVDSSPSLATRETSNVLLVGVSGGFPGWYAPLDMSENNLERDVKLNKNKTKKTLCNHNKMADVQEFLAIFGEFLLFQS